MENLRFMLIGLFALLVLVLVLFIYREKWQAETRRIFSADSLEIELKYWTKVRKPAGWRNNKPYWDRQVELDEGKK